jgi:hypothetical protein
VVRSLVPTRSRGEKGVCSRKLLREKVGRGRKKGAVAATVAFYSGVTVWGTVDEAAPHDR